MPPVVHHHPKPRLSTSSSIGGESEGGDSSQTTHQQVAAPPAPPPKASPAPPVSAAMHQPLPPPPPPLESVGSSAPTTEMGQMSITQQGEQTLPSRSGYCLNLHCCFFSRKSFSWRVDQWSLIRKDTMVLFCSFPQIRCPSLWALKGFLLSWHGTLPAQQPAGKQAHSLVPNVTRMWLICHMWSDKPM